MLNIENKEDETMTDIVYVVFDPAGPYIQGVYTTTDAVSIIASKVYDIVGAHNQLYIHKAQQDGKTLEDLQKEATEEEVE